MGLIVTILILPFVLSGVLARSRLVRSTENQEKALSFKRFHKYAGWFMIIVTQITIAFGIYSYTQAHLSTVISRNKKKVQAK